MILRTNSSRQQISLLVAIPEVCGSSSTVSSQLPGAAAAAVSVANAALGLANANAPFITISAPQYGGLCSSTISQFASLCDAIARDRPFAVIGPSSASSLSLTASALGAAGLPVFAFAVSASDFSASATGEAATWRSLVRVAPPEDVVVRAITSAIKLFKWEAVTLVTQGDAFGNRGLLL